MIILGWVADAYLVAIYNLLDIKIQIENEIIKQQLNIKISAIVLFK